VLLQRNEITVMANNAAVSSTERRQSWADCHILRCRSSPDVLYLSPSL